ncbi:MAG: hypothetical protein ACUVRU_05280 [Anaerolineae bacterium]
MNDHDLRQAMQATLDGSRSSHALLRLFLDHAGWHVPAARDARGQIALLRLKDDAGRRYLFLCTDKQAYADCLARVGADVLGEHFITIAGDELFDNLPDEVDIIRVNAYSPPELRYRGDQIPALRQWARAVKVERTLATPQPDLSLVKRFDAFYIVLRKLDGKEMALTLAPDKRGRKLAAVFTAPDTLEAFLRNQGDGGLKFEPQTVKTSGEILFDDLQHLPIDGIVFNCAGPVAPRLFVAGFAKAVMAA